MTSLYCFSWKGYDFLVCCTYRFLYFPYEFASVCSRCMGQRPRPVSLKFVQTKTDVGFRTATGGWFTTRNHELVWKSWLIKHTKSRSKNTGPGGRFKNTYELLNLRVHRFLLGNKIHIVQCMGKIFCVEFQRYPLKFHTKYLTHTLKESNYICW